MLVTRLRTIANIFLERFLKEIASLTYRAIDTKVWPRHITVSAILDDNFNTTDFVSKMGCCWNWNLYSSRDFESWSPYKKHLSVSLLCWLGIMLLLLSKCLSGLVSFCIDSASYLDKWGEGFHKSCILKHKKTQPKKKVRKKVK